MERQSVSQQEGRLRGGVLSRGRGVKIRRCDGDRVYFDELRTHRAKVGPGRLRKARRSPGQVREILDIQVGVAQIVRWIGFLPGYSDVVGDISGFGRIGVQRTRVGLVGIHIVQIVFEARVIRHHPEKTHFQCLDAPAAISVGHVIAYQCSRLIWSRRPGAR